MDITWYGLNCFRLTERSQLTIVTDPYFDETGLVAPKLKGDVVTISHNEPGYNAAEQVKGQRYILGGPGEYEIGGVFVTGIPMHYHDESKGDYRYNVAYLFKYPNDISVLHLGNLAHVPDQSTIQDLGEIHAALVPVGGKGTLNAAQAAEVIALIEPYYIVPMHYQLPGLALELDPVEKFVKAMGVSAVEEQDALRLNSTVLPEQPEVVVLQPNVGE
ncbi:MAG: MBL fold metallo-hydrolase [Anaerolineae bacterium]|nr:MBL fold metallo-hydrolase [Anaerolineae bacterium]